MSLQMSNFYNVLRCFSIAHYFQGANNNNVEPNDGYNQDMLRNARILARSGAQYLYGNYRVPQPVLEVPTNSSRVQLAKVIILGASGVGKTSIVQQFVWNSFTDNHVATKSNRAYYSLLIVNDQPYELKIIDVPEIPYFPANSYSEWSDYRFYGLRSAKAYILVFDLSDVESFEYLKTIRKQIAESRDTKNMNFPFIFVGNKQDLLTMANICKPNGSENSSEEEIEKGNEETRRNNIMAIIEKHWQCKYIQCSAKHNWHITDVFQELMKSIYAIQFSASTGPVELHTM